jgi:hypothetical protein
LKAAVILFVVGWELRVELDKKIDIAPRRVEVVPHSGAEDREASDVVAAAEFGDLFAFGEDEFLHGGALLSSFLKDILERCGAV